MDVAAIADAAIGAAGRIGELASGMESGIGIEGNSILNEVRTPPGQFATTHRDASSVLFDQFASNPEANSSSSVVLGTEEWVEDAGQVRLVDSRAVVFNQQHCPVMIPVDTNRDTRIV